MARGTIAVLGLCLSVGHLAAQRGYEWDHPDGVGVRYLLYHKLGPSKIDPDRFPSQIRAAYTPKDDADYIRVKGYPIAWGLYVYEFEEEGDGPKGARDFFANHDPRRRNREFLLDGEPLEKADASTRYWEFRDRFESYVVKSDAASGIKRLRWGECANLGVKFLVDRTMSAIPSKLGGNDRCQLLPPSSEWVRLRGGKRPVAWSMTVSEYGFAKPKRDPKRKRMPAWSATFEDRLERTNKTRKVAVRGRPIRGSKLEGKYYEYRDDLPAVTYHHAAASYRLGDREIVLDVKIPARRTDPDKKLWRRARQMVKSLVRWQPNAKAKKRGQYTYSVASSCKVEGKEVAMVVFIPVPKGRKPTASQLSLARKMAKSLRRETAKKSPGP